MFNIIKKYIDNMTKEDLYFFIKKNNYIISSQDVDIIYFYIKNYYNEFFSDPDIILNKIKKDVSIDTYNIILDLYNKYKKRI